MAKKAPRGISINKKQIFPMKGILKVYLLCFATFFLACKNDPKTAIPSNTATKANIPAINEQMAFGFIEKQLSFGVRVPGTVGHKQLQEWIIDQLNTFGAEVVTQKFEASFLGRKDVPCMNIMGQFNPKATRRILLAAHYDSRAIADKDIERQDQPIPGADDGASGVALLLEIARTISLNPINLGVDFIFFDVEDQGEAEGSATGNDWTLGSKYWSQNLKPKSYKADWGILLDMVGSKNATFGKEEFSRTYAGKYVDKVWTLAQRMGYSDFFQDFNAGAVQDDHFNVIAYARIPMINIINISPDDRRSFGHYHHRHSDNIEIIDPRTLKVVGQVVTAVIYKYSDGSL